VQQRREYSRYRLWFPVKLEAGGEAAMAMNHNIGAGGMMMVLGKDLAVGEAVTVTFQLPPGDVEIQVKGSVLRIEPNSEDPEGAWPLRVAVAFEDVDPELVPLLEEASAKFGS
jgi:PilZ domain